MNGSSLKISRIFRSKSMGTIYRARERCGAPVEIRMAAMAEFRKSGAKEPFLWNCAAAARRNRKAGYSVIMVILQIFSPKFPFPFAIRGRMWYANFVLYYSPIKIR